MKFNLILNGNNEFYPKINNKKYYILKVDNLDKIKWMINYFKKILEKVNNNLFYIGIDFEFNKISKGDRDVALMQINLENDQTDNAYIFILYPPNLDFESMNILIQLISEPKIIKILHGSESLDIPYLFNQVLKTKQNIDGFCTNFYDTKYLCNYNHIIKQSSSSGHTNTLADGKKSCSIYNLLIEQKIITKHKLKELENIEIEMGPIYLINIDIDKMDNNMLKYSLYDVLYLPELLKKFINNVKSSSYHIYSSIIPSIFGLINKYKRNIELEFNQLELIINQMNIYFIYENTNKILLKEIWEYYYYLISDSKKYLDNLKEINYFKNFIEIITKMIIYKCILKYYKVYKSNKEIVLNLNFNKYYIWFSNYTTLYNIFMEFEHNICQDLIKINKII